MVTQSPAAGRREHACGRRERAIVLLAIGLIALHIVDDSFVAAPAGDLGDATTWSGGLVPLAVLGARSRRLPAAARRVARGGRRSCSACSDSGTASEAWYYTREVGASGDDYTGLLAIPAGPDAAGGGRGDALAVAATRRADAAPLPAQGR